MLHREFPKALRVARRFLRRGFLGDGCSLALAVWQVARDMPSTESRPLCEAAENVIPGRPKFYARRFTLGR